MPLLLKSPPRAGAHALDELLARGRERLADGELGQGHFAGRGARDGAHEDPRHDVVRVRLEDHAAVHQLINHQNHLASYWMFG